VSTHTDTTELKGEREREREREDSQEMIVIMIWWTWCFGLFVGGGFCGILFGMKHSITTMYVGRMKMGGFYE
jgi:hypothetical protein